MKISSFQGFLRNHTQLLVKRLIFISSIKSTDTFCLLKINETNYSRGYYLTYWCETQNLSRRMFSAVKSATLCWPDIFCFIRQQLGQKICIYFHIQQLFFSQYDATCNLPSLLVDGQNTQRLNQTTTFLSFKDIMNLSLYSAHMGKHFSFI